MRIIEKYKLKVGDKITCNLDGINVRKFKITGIIGKITEDSFFLLNDTKDGSGYSGWIEDAKKYNKKYCWVMSNVYSDKPGLFLKKDKFNEEIQFYGKYF